MYLATKGSQSSEQSWMMSNGLIPAKSTDYSEKTGIDDRDLNVENENTIVIPKK